MFLIYCHEIRHADVNIPIFKLKKMKLREVRGLVKGLDKKWQHT